MVLTAKSKPEHMLVPPLADKELIYSLRAGIFYGVTHFNPHNLSPQLSKVIIESLSAGVSASSKYFIVLLTN